jgi:hypothetical protein
MALTLPTQGGDDMTLEKLSGLILAMTIIQMIFTFVVGVVITGEIRKSK